MTDTGKTFACPDDRAEVERLRAIVSHLEKDTGKRVLACEYGTTADGMLRIIVSAPSAAMSEKELAEHLASHINLLNAAAETLSDKSEATP